MQKNKKSILLKDFTIYVCLFVIFYLAVMLLKYLTNDNLNWLNTFLFMFSISIVLFFLRRTKRRDTDY